MRLRGPAPAHLGQLGERGFGLLQRLFRIAAGALDQPGRQPLGIVEQHLQEMLGRDLRIAFAHGKRLRRLDESLEAVGKFLEIHVWRPSGAGWEVRLWRGYGAITQAPLTDI